MLNLHTIRSTDRATQPKLLLAKSLYELSRVRSAEYIEISIKRRILATMNENEEDEDEEAKTTMYIISAECAISATSERDILHCTMEPISYIHA